MNNIEKYKKDLDSLISKGDMLHNAMQYECYPIEFEKKLLLVLGKQVACKKFISRLPSFCDEYQTWYSESLVLIKQLLPDRLNDFISYYEVPKNRKEIKYDSYRIADYLQHLQITNGIGDIIVDTSAAVDKFRQQLGILKAVQKRFESSLFKIQQLVQADLFDNELDAAKLLNKNKFMRAAGAMAGVVLERHLSQVLKNHNLTCKKNTISPLNDSLKAGDVYDLPIFRKIQHLGDIRNLCDHDSKREPTQEEVDEMIRGVDSIIKTVS
jgi:hypothetical protein